jgi:hypothetical protein
MAENDTFEVQVYLRDHWLTEDLFSSEREAQGAVAKLLRGDGVKGVRIIKAKTRQGAELERVIFTKMLEATAEAAAPIRAAVIQEAPRCESAGDLFKPQARQTATRVLRQYLEKFVLTPTEILHNHREMKRVLDFESLAPSAISRVASVQAKGEAASEATKRNAFLHDLVNGCAEQARRVSKAPDLPVLKDRSLGDVLAELDHKVPKDQQEYFATTILCTELVNTRSWLGKIETLLTLIENEEDARARKLVDPIIADIFGTTDGLRDLLGRQPDLVTALGRALDVAEGAAQKDDNTPEVTVDLSGRMSDVALAGARHALYQSVARQLKGAAQLNHKDASQQIEAYRRLIERLVRAKAVDGGSEMAEAIVFGFQRFVEQGGETGRRMCVERAVAAFSTSASRSIFILDLMNCELGAQYKVFLTDELRHSLLGATSINNFTPATLPLKDRMHRIAGLHERLGQSEIEPDLKERALSHIDGLMAAFVIEGKLIERLDDAQLSLRQRAVRLVQFCASEVLTRPKAHAIFRDRVVAHLKQPNFDDAFVADIAEPAARQTALRAFYALLRKAGFE